LSFLGKQVIHPNQVQPAHECFAPSESKVKWATDLMAAFHRHSLEGKVGLIYMYTPFMFCMVQYLSCLSCSVCGCLCVRS